MMKPLVLIVPAVILTGGVLCLVLLPAPLPVRLAVLVTDVMAAGVVGFLLSRRLR